MLIKNFCFDKHFYTIFILFFIKFVIKCLFSLFQILGHPERGGNFFPPTFGMTKLGILLSVNLFQLTFHLVFRVLSFR